MWVKPGLVRSPGMITLVQSPSPSGNEASIGCNITNIILNHSLSYLHYYPVIRLDLAIEKAIFFNGTVAVHRPRQLIGLKQNIFWKPVDSYETVYIYPILMSVGFWPEDWNSWPSVHFNMFPKQFYKVNFSRTILKFYRILKCSNRILCHTGIVAKVKPSVNTTENILGSKKCRQHNSCLPEYQSVSSLLVAEANSFWLWQEVTVLVPWNLTIRKIF